ncbi:hypothetical protein LMIY3S_03735 [Labrys miyagiensis]
MSDKPVISPKWIRDQIDLYRSITSIDDGTYKSGDAGRNGVVTDETPRLRESCERIVTELEDVLASVEGTDNA